MSVMIRLQTPTDEACTQLL